MTDNDEHFATYAEPIRLYGYGKPLISPAITPVMFADSVNVHMRAILRSLHESLINRGLYSSLIEHEDQIDWSKEGF